MSRGKVEVIRDPAVAIAAGKCWLARWGPIGIKIPLDSFHPAECSLCSYDMVYLVSAINEFLDWAGLRPSKDPKPLRAEVEGFLTLPAEEQLLSVRKVQGYE